MRVRSKVTEFDVGEGNVYEVARQNHGCIEVFDDKGDRYELLPNEYEEVPDDTPLGPMQKTVVIYDSCGIYAIMYRVVEGDIRHLDQKYGNCSENTEGLDDEINLYLFDAEWNTHPEFTKVFPVDAVRDGAHVIVLGFLP